MQIKNGVNESTNSYRTGIVMNINYVYDFTTQDMTNTICYLYCTVMHIYDTKLCCTNKKSRFFCLYFIQF